MKPKIYVDGQEGTTGLRIHEYLAQRADLEVLKIDPEKRKDPAERKKLLNAADIVFLCLPDVASREAVALVENPRTRVIDASTAFRTDPTWAYGLPELSPAQREKIRTGKRVAVPGCHATGFVLAVYPLVQAGILAPEVALTCFSLTGYSGGGKKMIAQYEDNPDPKLKPPRPYGLGLAHKHLPEMAAITGLKKPPVFTPVVCAVHSGMAVEVPLPVGTLAKRIGPKELRELFAKHYAGARFVRAMDFARETDLDGGFLDMTACNGTNRADLFVFGHDEQIALVTRLDNLGKGASGAAVQCLNIMLGVDEGLGLAS